MLHASFWQTVGAAGHSRRPLALKGLAARGVGEKNSASVTKGV